MTLAQVTRLDAGRYAKEQTELQTRISELELLLSDRNLLIASLKKEMQQLIKQFGDERRTIIDTKGVVAAPIETVASLHQREPLTVAVTRSGAIKALPSDTFVPKGKNGNATYTTVRGDEQLRQIIATTSQDYLLCVSSTGRVFQIATHRVPVGNRSAKGEPIRKILAMNAGEDIVMVLPIETYDEDRYLVTFSKLGKAKKSPLSEYKTADVDGLQDMKLADGDSIVAALLSRGQGEYLVSTDNGQTLRFSDESLRAQGRVGQGVAAITLAPKASVVSASHLDSGQATAEDFTSLLVVTENSFIKKVPVSQFPQKGRATAGVATTELLEKDRILLTTLISENDYLLLTWTGENGDQVAATKANELKTFPRTKRGIPLFNGHMLDVVKL